MRTGHGHGQRSDAVLRELVQHLSTTFRAITRGLSPDSGKLSLNVENTFVALNSGATVTMSSSIVLQPTLRRDIHVMWFLLHHVQP